MPQDPLKEIKENQFTILTGQQTNQKTSVNFERIGASNFVAMTIRVVVQVDQWGKPGPPVPITSDSCGVFDLATDFFTTGKPVVSLKNNSRTNFIKITAPSVNITTGGIKGEHGITIVKKAIKKKAVKKKVAKKKKAGAR